MNALLLAWETSVEDVENVLRQMGRDESLAPALFDNLDLEDVARAALRAEVGDSDEETLDGQTDAAYAEIKRQIESNE